MFHTLISTDEILEKGISVLPIWVVVVIVVFAILLTLGIIVWFAHRNREVTLFWGAIKLHPQKQAVSKEDMQRFLEREIAESGMPEDNSKTGRLVREIRERYITTYGPDVAKSATSAYRNVFLDTLGGAR